MDLLSFLSAAPKIALFFLLIIGGAIGVEIFYFKKKEESKIPEVKIPSGESPSISSLPQTPTSEFTPSPQSNSELLAKQKLSKQLLIPFLIFLFVLASLPAVVFLIKQRQEIRKEAAGENYPEGCCYNKDLGQYRECPAGQTCDIPNGACGDEGLSCNPQGSGYHKACVNNQCVNVPGTGENQCLIDEECQVSTPTPTPSSSCNCSFGYACHYNNCVHCSTFDEPTCHTHAVSCHWEAGSCREGGQSQVSPGLYNVSCSVSSSGFTITNNGQGQVTGTITYYSSWCDHRNNSNCFCSGPTQSKTITLQSAGQSGSSYSEGIIGAGPPTNCAWQTDVTFTVGGQIICHDANHGCVSGCEVTPNPGTAQCIRLKAYKSDWTQITDLSSLKPSDIVYFAVSGSSGTTKARFKINNGNWQETQNKHIDEFYIQYTIPSTGSYRIEAMVYHPTLGWW